MVQLYQHDFPIDPIVLWGQEIRAFKYPFYLCNWNAVSTKMFLLVPLLWEDDKLWLQNLILGGVQLQLHSQIRCMWEVDSCSLQVHGPIWLLLLKIHILENLIVGHLTIIIIYRQEIFQILLQHLGIVQDQLLQKTNFWLSICHIED